MADWNNINEEAAAARPGPQPVAAAPAAASPPMTPSRQFTTESARSHTQTNSQTSSMRSKLRRLSTGFEESRIPGGFSAATADIASSVFSFSDDRSSLGTRRRSSAASRTTTMLSPLERNKGLGLGLDGTTAIPEGDTHGEEPREEKDKAAEQTRQNSQSGPSAGMMSRVASALANPGEKASVPGLDEAVVDTAATAGVEGDKMADAELTGPFKNGYHFPPAYSTGDSVRKGLLAFWRFAITPVGFLVTVYGLNVVAWGGMLFLLLCNASPAMCYPTCNAINSPRRIWVEYDSQILNALFCVTGFGLAPWRFRDIYYLLTFRLAKDHMALRRLAGIHRGWVRLPGSQDLPVEFGPDTLEALVPEACLPYPTSYTPPAPLTGLRAPPTALWKIDMALWLNVSNTFLQCCLAGFMWGMTRYTRPSWATGLFVALACIAAAAGGLIMFLEGKKVKGIEGVPLTDEDREKLARDEEAGILHYNNLKDKKP